MSRKTVILHDSNFKKLFISISVCGIFMFLLLGSFYYFVFQNSIQKTNVIVESLVATIEEKYPNVSDLEILEVLNSSQVTSFFQNYGIDLDHVSAISELQNSQTNFLLLFIVIFALSFGIIFILLLFYNKKNHHEINQIIQLIEDINHKIYTISLEEHDEGVYSVLKSELYKTTILLKEQAENSELEKLALKTALSDISHQIKTPLTSILIMLDTLTDYSTISKEKEQEFLEDIRMQIQRIHFLIMTLLKLARFDADAVTLKEERIMGEVLIEQVLTDLEVLSLSKNIQFQVLGKNCFIGDIRFLKEAFLNILKNCIEASYEEGKIIIEMEDTPFYSKFLIKDFGKGIEKQELPYIFDRFFKSKNASSESIGIGLSLSKKIIERHHGSISCKSKVGKGSVFEIKFMKKF